MPRRGQVESEPKTMKEAEEQGYPIYPAAKTGSTGSLGEAANFTDRWGSKKTKSENDK